MVLVKTIYYPSFEQDTLNNVLVHRDCYMISVFDQDTNRDGFINSNDLRRFYHFELPGLTKTALIPKNYSVYSSEYDPGNDHMYVYAKLDGNQNGMVDVLEETHIFWVDLKDPRKNGLLF